MSYTTPNTPAPTTHYVARIVVERVDHNPTEARDGMVGTKRVSLERTVTELASFTPKNNTLEGLVDKVGAHLHLIEDIDALDAVRMKGTRSDG